MSRSGPGVAITLQSPCSDGLASDRAPTARGTCSHKANKGGSESTASPKGHFLVPFEQQQLPR